MEAISNFGTLTVQNCTLTANDSYPLYNNCITTVTDSTLNGNYNGNSICNQQAYSDTVTLTLSGTMCMAGGIYNSYACLLYTSLSEKTVTFYYANPNASNQNVSILIMVNDLVVAKSDLITPGNQVSKLELQKDAASKLQVGGYNAELVVRAYDPDSGEKAMVDTKGELTLTVTE